MTTISEEIILTKEEVNTLFIEYKRNNSDKAKDRIILAHTTLVKKLASFYSKRNPNIDFEDFFQEGIIGLMIALENFDPEKGFTFATYASDWVRKYMLQLTCTDRIIPIPERVMLKTRTIGKELEKGKDVDNQNLKLYDHTQKIIQISSIQNSICDDMDEVDILAEEKTPEEISMEEDIKRNINKIIKESLVKKEQYVIVKYFGLDGETPMSLNEIGKKLNKSKSHVRFVKDRSIQVLRNVLCTDYDIDILKDLESPLRLHCL